jgi:hypothetical protein
MFPPAAKVNQAAATTGRSPRVKIPQMEIPSFPLNPKPLSKGETSAHRYNRATFIAPIRPLSDRINPANRAAANAGIIPFPSQLTKRPPRIRTSVSRMKSSGFKDSFIVNCDPAVSTKALVCMWLRKLNILCQSP